ncbi:Zn-dependent hydrolase (plasmid) [Aminobacter sp. Y103A]|uniref:Zn-dependent hydrolase n=1 Tax=Aminobacter sp. Y103A TaxID=1870862 RepID=UPI002572BEF3|nr:Zn-dependent hydrolase [Aminobacter sp. SS-2016]BBD41500.1 Zn-dependent hydrolase [Aminobacter sp. SS-2016]
MTNTLEVDGSRLWETLMASAEIGATSKGGLCRMALTDADRDMRDLFVRWCTEAGLSMTVDQVGNIFARRQGTDKTAKPVMIGSHLDTQIRGGRFDGILGVLAGLEVIRTLNDRAIDTIRPIEVVCWTNEEGVRFQPPMMGAGAFAGIHDIEFVLAQQAEDGAVFGEELKRIGYAGETRRDPVDIDSYFELHIEQGPILDEEGLSVGIVTGGFTSFGTQVRFHGENAHSGPTPMRARKDALVGLATLVNRVNEIGWEFEPKGRATCTRVEISPNRYGIIADEAEVTVDVRHPNAAQSQEMFDGVNAAISSCAQRANVRAEIVKQWSFGDIAFDTALINLVRSVAADLNVSHKHLLSAAGHDAYHLSKIAPTAMIFTPCRDGISHNEAEDVELDRTLPGVNVLLNAVLRRANQ